MTYSTKPPEWSKPILNIGNTEILCGPGKFDDYCIITKFQEPISKNKSRTIYLYVDNIELYRSYMKSLPINPMNIQDQKKWDELNFDLFKMKVGENYEGFADNIKKVFEKHNWIISRFSGVANKNDFFRAWKTTINNICGILCIARLIGDSRDRLCKKYENSTDPHMPVSVRIGKHATKDCLYKINKGIYPDFYEVKPYTDLHIMKSIVKEPKVIHYSINEILKDYRIPDAYDIWARKLERFYKTETYRELFVVPDEHIRSILLRSVRKTIYESLLSKDHKEEEIDNLNDYGMY